MLLSVVIPSYNSEKFIQKNLPTLIDRRLSGRTEILVINDGSTDRTGELADRFARDNPGIVRVIHKENGGHGSVINRGIMEARGKYFKVIDADDWVITDNLVRLVDGLEKTDADAVINPYYNVDERSGKKVLQNRLSISEEELQIADLTEKKTNIVMHSITYKTEILRECRMAFTEKCYYDDFQYNLYPVPYIKKILYYDFPVYMYLVGQKNQSVSAAASLKNMGMYLKVLEDAVFYYEGIRGPLDADADRYMRNALCTFTRSVYNIYLRNRISRENQQRMLETDRKIKDISPEIYREVGEQNGYIRELRKKEALAYGAFSILLKVRKAFEIS